MVAPHVEWIGGDAGVPVSSVEGVHAGRDATPSAAEPPGEEENVGVVRPSQEEMAGWVDPTPLPFPGPTAEALANRLGAPEAALGEAGVGAIV